MADTSKVTVETLQRLLGAFNAHDLDAVMSLFTDDCVLEMPRGPHPWGRRFEGWQAARSGLASRFAGIPDVHYGADRHWVNGDRGCSEWLLTGTATQGEPIEVRGCDLFEFRAARSPARTPTGSWSSDSRVSFVSTVLVGNCSEL